MAVETSTFFVREGIHGMNRLAQALNAAGLAGGWHFASGTRFDQTAVEVCFDVPEDSKLEAVVRWNDRPLRPAPVPMARPPAFLSAETTDTPAPLTALGVALKAPLARVFDFFARLSRR